MIESKGSKTSFISQKQISKHIAKGLCQFGGDK